MLERTDAYDAAITGDVRAILLRAVVDISDPDKEFLPYTTSPEAPFSHKEELRDHLFSTPGRYATLERGRWLLDGSYNIFPADYDIGEPVGYASDAISGRDGTFSTPITIQSNFQNVRILQAMSLFFPSDANDGYPLAFTVDVLSGSTVYYTQDFVGNRETSFILQGFTVYSPTAIRLTIHQWSVPHRRVRMVEFFLGLYEDWSTDDLAEFSVKNEGQFSCLTLPYGTANIAIDNLDRRFEPRNKDGIFQSIEERQGIELYLGVALPDGGVEYKKIGTYYQTGNGWKTGNNALTMRWSLVDIIGLVANRAFIVPDTLPTTLSGWIGAVVAQLGYAFETRFHVDPAYADRAVTAKNRAAVTGKTCGDIIRWACMATGTWPRADNATGKLTAEPLWNEGSKLDLDNLRSYPTMRANESLAALVFHLSGGEEYVVSGNSTSSEKTVTIENPFLHTMDQAMEASRLILAQYGGNVIEITGRGNPASEIGDVDTVWLDKSNATTARRQKQEFRISDGVLRDCPSTLLQADGSYLWTGYAVIRESGKWQAPPGVTQLRIVLGQGGQGGGFGDPGYIRMGWSNNVEAGEGAQGQDGQGGKVWYGVIDINDGQEFDVVLGAGGAAATQAGVPGELGGHTTFGGYSSEAGTIYPNGYTDISNALSFARTGVELPLPGTGDGGKGGKGGEAGAGYLEQGYFDDGTPSGFYLIVTKRPGEGKKGVDGATGFVLVTWDKEAVSGV